MTECIKVNDLSFWYGKKQILKNVNFTAEQRVVTSIIGPSGCGKTTLLRCINRMYEVYPKIKVQGTINVNGENVLNKKLDSADIRRRVGMIFQKPNPFPHMSLFENIACGIRLHGLRKNYEIKDRVEECLRKVALWDEVKDTLNKSGAMLSGGQQQRLCIARAMAVEPDVFLMDEPCASLDPMSMLKVEELIKELQREYTVVIVTHNMQQAARISKNTVFMLNGEMIEAGLTFDMFIKAKDKRTEDYISGKMG